MKRIGRVGTAAMLAAAGLALSTSSASAGLEVIAVTGNQHTAMNADGLVITQLEHASASPNGRIMVVGRASDYADGPSVQAIWVRDPAGAWRRLASSGRPGVAAVPGSIIGLLQAAPVINNRGDVLTLATLTGPNQAGVTVTTPALLTLGADGATGLNLRFNIPAGPGVPAGVGTTGISFAGPASDTLRLSSAGALYASALSGLLGPCGPGMCFRTFVNRASTQAGGTPITVGTAVTVTSAQSAIGMCDNGVSVQVIKADGYTREGLAGTIMWDRWGIPTFAVRDGATPIDGLPGQVVLSTGTSLGATGIIDPSIRVGINSAGTLVFPGRFGPMPISTGLPGGTVPPPVVAGTIGLILKEPGANARLIAQALSGSNAAQAAVPGLPGATFSQFNAPVVNARGTVAFTATLSGARNSVWLYDAARGLRPVAITGIVSDGSTPAAPPAAGLQFASIISEPVINARGQVVFYARVASSTATRAVLCGFDPVLGLSILAGTGDKVTIPGVGEVVATLEPMTDIGGRPIAATGNDDGAATMLTDGGTVVFRAGTTAGVAVLSTEVVTPRGACCAGATCAVIAGLDCAGTATRFAGANTVCSATGAAAAPCCVADFDQSGQVGVGDLLNFVQAYLVQDAKADADGSGHVTLDDLFAYLQSYLGGC